MIKVGKFMTSLLLALWASSSAWAIVPLESLILGDLSATNSSRAKDPLFNVFQSSRDRAGKDGDRERVALYRGFIDEGENLQRFCREDSSAEFRYPSQQQYEQATRTMVATTQYIGLDMLTRALPAYAKSLQWSRDDFEKFSSSLVGNWCSQNLTVVSHKELKRNFMLKWDSESNFSLPDIENNAFFPQKLLSLSTKEDRRAREFYWSTELFKAFCSWSNTTEDFRMMIPVLRDPIIMAFVTRQMNGRRLVFNPRSQVISRQNNQQTNRVACRGLVCRKTDNEGEYRRRMPRSIGSPGLYEDSQRIYCKRMREATVNYNDPDERVRKILNDRTLEENLLMAGQFKALITGAPNLLIWTSTYDQAQGVMRTSFDRSWDEWAQGAIDKLSGDLTYEEPLTVELVGRELFYNRYRKKFAVHFDVNQGEFDRVNRVAGKISTTFNLKISHKMLNWIRKTWTSLDPTMKVERRDLINRFKSYIKKDVKQARDKFVIPPWRGDIEEIIVVELLDQFSKFIGDWDYPDDGFANIPVSLHYGPFALRLMHYRHLVKEREKTLLKADDNKTE